MPAGGPRPLLLVVVLLLLLVLPAQAPPSPQPPTDLHPVSAGTAQAFPVPDDVEAYTDLLPPPDPSANAGWRRADREEDLVVVEEPVSPHVYAGCCAHAATPRCLQVCLGALDGPGLTLGRLLDALQAEDCHLVPYEPLFLCLVSRSSVPAPGAGAGAVLGAGAGAVSVSGAVAGAGAALDAARLHCCALARAPACRRACDAAYRDDWSAARSGGALHRCTERANETALSSCLAEVDAECRPGSHCSGLDFCAEVLGPPSWFRTCSAASDAAARATAARWARDARLPTSDADADGVPLLTGTGACGPRLWRSLACLLHAQPCSPRGGTLPVCLQDCLRLLPRCVRWSAVAPGFSAEQLCQRMSAPPPCVRIPGDVDDPGHESLLAEAGAEEAAPPPPPPLPPPPAGACLLGAASDVAVAGGTAVRVPARGRDAAACYDACLCGGDPPALGRCVALPCAPHSARCSLGAGTIEHRRTVVLDCLVCTCASGDTLCTQRQCAAPAAPTAPAAPAAPPCRCPLHAVPVCGDNGRTYDNACLARCAGLDAARVRPGPCQLLDPCAAPGAAPVCPTAQRCVPEPNQCLSSIVQPCPQHQCVDLRCDVDGGAGAGACDTQGRSHRDLCELAAAGATPAHRGPCGTNGSEAGPVCGADGYTYPSREAAWASRVPVDYPGVCLARAAPGAAGAAGAAGAGAACPAHVRCPPLPPGCARGVRLLLACCDTCASVLRASLNVKAVDRAVLGVQRHWPRLHAVFSLQALLAQLQLLVLEPCAVLGYLSGADQLTLVLQPEGVGADAVLRCFEEAERLAGLFEQSASRVQASLLLAALHGVVLGPAPVPAGPRAAPGAAAAATAPELLLLLLPLLWHWQFARPRTK